MLPQLPSKRQYSNMADNTDANTSSTERNKDTAIRLHMDDFLKSQGMPVFDACGESDLCKVSLFGQFTTYLLEKENLHCIASIRPRKKSGLPMHRQCRKMSLS